MSRAATVAGMLVLRPRPGRLPGLSLCAAATGAALLVGWGLPVVSPLLVAIGLGAVLANTVGVPTAAAPGLAVAAKRLLRAGVALLGLQLVLTDVAGLGAGMVAVVIAVVAGGILGTLAIGRWLEVPAKQRLLIACGFSICGAAAVAAVDGVDEFDQEDVVTAVALVVVFGTVMIPLIPLAARLAGFDAAQAGGWAGGSIHEVAQVVAAGGVIGGVALKTGVVVKLARVLLLAPVLAVVGLRARRSGRTRVSSGGRRPPVVPVFVLGFAAFAMLRTTGVVPAMALEVARLAQTALLTAAMFALGAGTRLGALRRLGSRPLLLAALSTLLVTGIALAGPLLVL